MVFHVNCVKRGWWRGNLFHFFVKHKRAIFQGSVQKATRSSSVRSSDHCAFNGVFILQGSPLIGSKIVDCRPRGIVKTTCFAIYQIHTLIAHIAHNRKQNIIFGKLVANTPARFLGVFYLPATAFFGVCLAKSDIESG